MIDFDKNLILGSHTFQSRNGNIGVCTPHTFHSGQPAVYYIDVRGNTTYITDYGMNLSFFEDTLPNPSKAYHTLKRLIKRYESSYIKLSHGIITAQCPKPVTSLVIGYYLDILSAMTRYTPQTIEQQDDMELFDTIYHFLMLKHRDIETNVKVKGLSGETYEVWFKQGNKYIDYTKATPSKTGKLLRKIIDIANSQDNAKFQIFLDDSDKEQFKQEAGILNSIASITPISLINTATIH